MKSFFFYYVKEIESGLKFLSYDYSYLTEKVSNFFFININKDKIIKSLMSTLLFQIFYFSIFCLLEFLENFFSKRKITKTAVFEIAFKIFFLKNFLIHFIFFLFFEKKKLLEIFLKMFLFEFFINILIIFTKNKKQITLNFIIFSCNFFWFYLFHISFVCSFHPKLFTFCKKGNVFFWRSFFLGFISFPFFFFSHLLQQVIISILLGFNFLGKYVYN